MVIVKKRLCCVMMSCLMIIIPLCAAMVPKMQVKAAGVLGAEQTIELLQILYSALASGMMVSGAVNADYTDADTAGEIFTEFMNSMSRSIGGYGGEIPAWALDSTYTMSDGTVYTIYDLVEDMQALDDPAYEDEELATGTWGKLGVKKVDLEEDLRNQFRVVDGGGGTDPEQEPNDNYPNVSGFTLASGFFGMMADFISDIWADDVNGTKYFYPDENFDDKFGFKNNCYKGHYPTDADGNYYIQGNYVYTNGSNTWLEKITFDTKYNFKVVGVLNGTVNSYGNISYEFYIKSASTLINCYVPCSIIRYDLTGKILSQSTSTIDGVLGTIIKSAMNIPVFSTMTQAEAYFENGTDTGILNGTKLNHTELISDGVGGSLSIFEGKQLKPETFANAYKALDTSYNNQVAPQISDDPVLNTDLFNQIMASTAANVASNSEIIPDTDPVTDPVKVPGQLPSDIPITIPSDQPINIPQSEEDLRQDTAVEAETALDEAMNGSNYKYDLSDVFPFCIPFDFVDLLKALSAEPKTPSFEFPFVVPILGINNVYVIDLNWMNTVMQIVRTMEIVGFLMFLMVLTGKVIKW